MRSSIANTTAISSRLFRTQRQIIMVIVACFVVLLVVTSLAAHHNVKLASVTEKMLLFYDTDYLWGGEAEGQVHQTEAKTKAAEVVGAAMRNIKIDPRPRPTAV